MAVSLGAKGSPRWALERRGNVPEVRLQGALNATPGSWLLWRTARSQELANFQDGIIESDSCSRRWWYRQVGPNLEATAPGVLA